MLEKDVIGRNIVCEELWVSLWLKPMQRAKSYNMFLQGDETEHLFVLMIWRDKKDNNFEIHLCSTYTLFLIGNFIDYNDAQKTLAMLAIYGYNINNLLSYSSIYRVKA